MLLREKADQAQALLQETRLDCWLTFARETDIHPDPGVELVVGAGVVRNSAFLFGAGGQRIAIVARFDVERAQPFVDQLGELRCQPRLLDFVLAEDQVNRFRRAGPYLPPNRSRGQRGHARIADCGLRVADSLRTSG